MQALETERLILRPCTLEDVDALYRALVLEQEEASITVEDVANAIKFDLSLAQQPLGADFGRLAVVIKDVERAIGLVPFMPRICTREELDLFRPPADGVLTRSRIEIEIGWTISAHFRGQGYATEAAGALIDHAFTTLKLARVVALTTGANTASINVMKRLGMQIGCDPAANKVVGIIENTVN